MENKERLLRKYTPSMGSSASGSSQADKVNSTGSSSAPPVAEDNNEATPSS